MPRSSTGRISSAVLSIFMLLSSSASVSAQVIFGNSGLNGGFRWDAAPRTIGGFERSLDGGLRYSVDGGSLLAFRDSFSWTQVPTQAEFTTLVQQAFDAWGSTDPVSGFTSSLTFVYDPTTAVNATVSGGVRFGAEIDLFATDLGDSGRRGFASFNAVGGTVELTSGTQNYNALPISGADVTLNSNSGAIYSPDIFRRLLTHELGHAVGFGDVEGDINPNAYIDDNYDGSSSATALATLTNSWAYLVDPLDPSASTGLSIFTVPDSDPGVDTFGVDILMESRGLGIGPNNPVDNLVPLATADYSIRQFLYPSLTAVPEPGSAVVLGAACLLVFLRRRMR